ncbi:MAG: sulfotransferase domain-containing protein [Candidatus Promineofilum sp.]|nr:sulfotransferase domain-containing protein [Promineifilum sp.]
MRVDFMMIGAQKAGTTSLAAQLAAHPQICFCQEKEPGYFHKTEDWAAGLEQYHSLYSPTPGQLCGEASTYYTFFPEFLDTHKRLYEYNPALKLIYVVRQPVERIISHYTHNRVREIDTRPPEEAVFAAPAYVDRSRYGVQIRPYMELFGPENVLLLVFEEYTADQIATLYRVAEFLGIEPGPFAETDTTPLHQSVGQPYLRSEAARSFTKSELFQKVRAVVPAAIRQPIRHRLLSNKIDEKPYFAPEVKQALWRLLEDDVHTIEQMLGYSLNVWRRGYAEEA